MSNLNRPVEPKPKQVLVKLSTSMFDALPQKAKTDWIRQAIAEKLQRESKVTTDIGDGVIAYLKTNSAEYKAIQRIANQPQNDEWVVADDDPMEEVDLDEIRRKLIERGYKTQKVSTKKASPIRKNRFTNTASTNAS